MGVAALFALLVIGCSAPVQPSPSTALAGVSQTSAPSPTTQPPPTIAATERELSDRFWGRVITYGLFYDFHSLEEIVADSDLIVRGRITDRTTLTCSAGASTPPGRPEPCEGSLAAFVVVSVDAVLKGDGRFGSGTVLVRLETRNIPESEIPRGELLLFLKNYGQFYTEEVAPEPSDSPRWSWYYINTNYQGALRNLDGVVDVPDAPEGWWDDHGPFPHDMDGQPFENVVSRIRALAAS